MNWDERRYQKTPQLRCFFRIEHYMAILIFEQMNHDKITRILGNNMRSDNSTITWAKNDNCILLTIFAKIRARSFISYSILESIRIGDIRSNKSCKSIFMWMFCHIFLQLFFGWESRLRILTEKLIHRADRPKRRFRSLDIENCWC